MRRSPKGSLLVFSPSYFSRIGSNRRVGPKVILKLLDNDLPVDIHLRDPISVRGEGRRHLFPSSKEQRGLAVVSRDQQGIRQAASVGKGRGSAPTRPLFYVIVESAERVYMSLVPVLFGGLLESSMAWHTVCSANLHYITELYPHR